MRRKILLIAGFLILWIGMGFRFISKIHSLKAEENQLYDRENVPHLGGATTRISQKQRTAAPFFKQEVYVGKHFAGKEKDSTHSARILTGKDKEEKNVSPRILFQQFEQQLPCSYPNEQDLIIYGDAKIDNYIREKAKKRGYKLHKVIPKNDLILFKGKYVAKECVHDLENLFKEVAKRGLKLGIISGYRSPSRQRTILRSKLGDTLSKENVLSGKLDREIENVLSRSSIPGYSKHHTGHAFDFVCGEGGTLGPFGESKCYAILAKDDFALPKKYGFLPSYPEGEEHQGPDPEPWEFVWVGDLARK